MSLRASTCICALLGLVSSVAYATPETTINESSPHYDLEVMYDKDDLKAGMALTRERLKADPYDPVLAWMFVRFNHELGETIEGPDSAKADSYEYAAAVATKALEKHPNDPHLRFARAIANARLGTTRGVMASLSLADDIEADWLFVAKSGFKYAALGGQEVLPCDADLALGIFYRLVPDYWIVKAIAGTRGDLDKSLMHLQAANTCLPNEIRIVKELGATQLCLGTKRKDTEMLKAGKETLTYLRTLPTKALTDEIDAKHAQQLISDPDLACGYSRDGQQEQDEKLLKKDK